MDHSVHKITVYRIVSIALLIVLALLMLFPLYWIITGSVKGAKEINARVPSFFPVSPTTANYAKLFSKPAWTWLLNTVFICGMTMLLACLCGAMGGYALAKKQFAGRGLIFTMFVCAMALPKQVIMIPLLKEMAFSRLPLTDEFRLVEIISYQSTCLFGSPPCFLFNGERLLCRLKE